MKRLPPDKRNKLILVIMGTLASISLVYFFLIAPQKEENHKMAVETGTDQARLQLIKTTIKQATATTGKAGEIAVQLTHAEEDAATGDVFAWTYDTIRQFKINRHVEITSIGQPTPSDVDIIPSFPYKQIRFQIMGNGYYHDIGKFAADLENKFPHMRIVTMSIDTSSGPDALGEKLSFRMEIAALVKPNA